MLKPRIKITCPLCGEELRCQVRDVNVNDASWAFTAESFAHLQAANCAAPKLLVPPGGGPIICKEAA